MSRSPYLKLNTKPALQGHLLTVYYLESDLPLSEAAVKIAEESSIGTWTDLATLNKKTQAKLGPKIYCLETKNRIVKIAYPLDLFELGNIAQLLSALAGNIFSMKVIKNLRLLDIQFPQ